MDVFKTRVSNDTHSLIINEENYQKATKLQKPFVRNGSYFAVCPECNNPIQIVGLFLADKDMPKYGKHVKDEKGKLKEIATYNEINKENCKFYSGKYCDDPFASVEKGTLDKVLCRTMRDEFDKVVYFWNVLTGIKLGRAMAKKYLEDWIERKIYFLDFCTTSTLSISLRCAVEPENLFDRWIDVNSELYAYLSTELKDMVYFEKTGYEKWEKVRRKTNYFSTLEFNFLPFYRRTTSDSGCIERMTLQVISVNRDVKKEKELKIKIESSYWDNILNMQNFNRDTDLLDFAKAAFQGEELD